MIGKHLAAVPSEIFLRSHVVVLVGSRSPPATWWPNGAGARLGSAEGQLQDGSHRLPVGQAALDARRQR